MSLAGNIVPVVHDTLGTTPVIFDITGLTRSASLTANKNATDEIKISGNFFNLVFEDNFVRVNTTQINLTGFNASTVIGAGNNQTSWYRNTTWTGLQSFDGAGGTDQVIVSDNLNLTMTPTLMTLGSSFNVSLQSIESFKYKGFDPTAGSSLGGNNTITLSQWDGVGIIEGGDGDDQIVIDRSTFAAAQVIEIKPTAMTVNGKVINIVKPDPTKLEAKLTGGSGNDSFSLSNWRGTATITGNGGTNTLYINRDRDMDLSTGEVLIKKLATSTTEVNKAIDYSTIQQLTAAGGSGANIYTLNAGYDTGLAAGTNGLSILTNSNGDTLKTSLPMNIDITTGTSNTTIKLGATRTLSATNFQSPDIVNFTGTAANAYTFTNYTGKGTLTGMNSVAFTFNTAATNVAVNSGSVVFNNSSAQTFNINGALAGGLSLTGGAQVNNFTVNSWSKNLTVNGGPNTASVKDTFIVNTAASNVTLSGDKISATLAQTGLPTWNLSNIEVARIIGTNTSAVGQTFTLTDWSYGGNLTANLTSKNDRLIYQHDGNITLTNGALTAGTKLWSISNVDTATLTGGNTNDTIDARNFGGVLTIDGAGGDDIIYGGAKNDRLDGSGGNDWIFGGAGDDILTGGNGQDILVGGVGIDKLNTADGLATINDSGEDVIIGGTTSYDASSAANTNAILAIMTEWSKPSATPGNDFVSRINKLKALPAKLDLGTVQDDGFADLLFGGAQDDWYFHRPTTEPLSSLTSLENGQKIVI